LLQAKLEEFAGLAPRPWARHRLPQCVHLWGKFLIVWK
jgi:hypothetical protein